MNIPLFMNCPRCGEASDEDSDVASPQQVRCFCDCLLILHNILHSNCVCVCDTRTHGRGLLILPSLHDFFAALQPNHSSSAAAPWSISLGHALPHSRLLPVPRRQKPRRKGIQRPQWMLSGDRILAEHRMLRRFLLPLARPLSPSLGQARSLLPSMLWSCHQRARWSPYLLPQPTPSLSCYRRAAWQLFASRLCMVFHSGMVTAVP